MLSDVMVDLSVRAVNVRSAAALMAAAAATTLVPGLLAPRLSSRLAWSAALAQVLPPECSGRGRADCFLLVSATRRDDASSASAAAAVASTASAVFAFDSTSLGTPAQEPASSSPDSSDRDSASAAAAAATSSALSAAVPDVAVWLAEFKDMDLRPPGLRLLGFRSVSPCEVCRCLCVYILLCVCVRV